ncbi:MAG: sugar porter family MFS transporter [Gammaproteobacteria bacterium]|nr:sugar porter family MFS transporter [Gammaproteobacteria bacterium]
MRGILQSSTSYTIALSFFVALGGFLMGFDASVISGVVGFVENEFNLTDWQLGWVVSSLTLSATIAMLCAGPLSDYFGRRVILQSTAFLFAISAFLSAWAPSFEWLVIARMIGGLGVGGALIIAPVYIAEISPPHLRGRLVSLNQLNIVIGISLAFFSNYLILGYADNTTKFSTFDINFSAWRVMLAVEFIPALFYFIVLFYIPESPRWLALKGDLEQARQILEKTTGKEASTHDLADIQPWQNPFAWIANWKKLFSPSMRKVLMIGIVIGITQQATGINAVFFYAPMIFEQTGVSTNSAFLQAVAVGVVNLVFTIIAIALIDRLGRRILLNVGLAGIVISMFVLSYGFYSASYQLSEKSAAEITEQFKLPLDKPLSNEKFESDLDFKSMLNNSLGKEDAKKIQRDAINASININTTLILFGILGFVACFAVSLGPVMWVLLSEIFPNHSRGAAISLVGLLNSSASFGVQLVFPWQLNSLGNATAFLIFGSVALIGLVFVFFKLPETKNKSLEQLEKQLVQS